MQIEERSCGCIIIDKKDVLLIQQTSGAWGFPKGHPEHDEDEEATAIREVKEETNLSVKINPKKRYTMYYRTDAGKNKEVVLFLAEKVGGELKIQEDELLDAKWLDVYDALELLTYENTKELFEQVLKENKL
ncbi:MAG: NUDIX domain-containing protein [Clostridia bacterium]|nr:NUDIX domain-containing protein [Clostridia bacterium]